MLASILTSVVYGRELALLLMAATSVSMTLLLGEGLPQLVMMAAAFTSCTLFYLDAFERERISSMSVQPPRYSPF